MDIIQGTVRLKRKRKWKTRWAVLRRVNPAADVINLIFYKDQVTAQARQKEKLFISLADYCGLQSLEKLDKILTVIVIITVTDTVSFGFNSIGDRADWLQVLQNNFGEERSFDGVIPNRQKLKPQEATLRVYNTHFCITRRDNFNCLGKWKYEDVPYYGAVDGGFAFKSVTTANNQEEHDLHFMSTRSGRELHQVFDGVCHRMDKHAGLHKVTYSGGNTDSMERRKTEGHPNFLKRAFLRLSRRGTRKRTRSEGAVLEKFSRRDKGATSKQHNRRGARSEADTLDGKDVACSRPLPTPPGAINKNKSLTGERFRFDSASIEAYDGGPRKVHKDSPLTLQTDYGLGYELVDKPSNLGYEIVDEPDDLGKKGTHISPRIETIKPELKPRVGLKSVIDRDSNGTDDGVKQSANDDDKNVTSEIPVIEIQSDSVENISDSGKISDSSPEKEMTEAKIAVSITLSGRDSGIEKDVDNGQPEEIKQINDVEDNAESGIDTEKENEKDIKNKTKNKIENANDTDDQKSVLSPNDSVITGEEVDDDEENESSVNLSVDQVTTPPLSSPFIYEPMAPTEDESLRVEEKSQTESESEEETKAETAGSPKDSNSVKNPTTGGSILTRRTSNNKIPFQQLTVSITKEDKVKPRPPPPPPPESANSDYVNLRGSEILNNISPEVRSAEAVVKPQAIAPQKKLKTPWSKYDGVDDSVYHSVESLMPDGRRAVHGYQNIKYTTNGRAHSFESLDGVHSYANMPAPSQYQNLGPSGRSYINVPSKNKGNLNYIQVGVAELGPPTPRSQGSMSSEYTFIDEVKTNVLKKAAREHSYLRKENLARVTKK